MPSMRLGEIVRFLGLFVDLERIGSDSPMGRQYNLDEMRSLLAALGNPERAFRSIHVAGTDGKGSVCAMLHHLLTRAGRRVGLYTSPHLETLPERIVLGDCQLPVDTLADYLLRVADVMGVSVEESLAAGRVVRTSVARPTALRQGYATVFEMLTAVAFCAFADHHVDVAVVEVGLGGRLDCTNLIVPLVSVVTSIDTDHRDRLGKNLLAIAREKLGIVKPGVPVVLGEQYHEDVLRFALRCLEDHDAEREAVQSEWTWEVTQRSPEGYGVKAVRRQQGEEMLFRVGLVGDHQAANAVAALAALRHLPAELREGVDRQDLAGVRWPGRFELVMPEGALEPVVLDCAHTPQAAFALRQTLDQLYPGPRAFVVAQLRDKMVRQFAEHLFRPGDVVVATSTGNPRSLPPMKLADEIRTALDNAYPTGRHNVLMATDAATAIRKAAVAAPTATLVITGSIYLVGDARRLLRTTSGSDLFSA